MAAPLQPPPDCSLCPRLVAHRHAISAAHPGWHNAPVPDWGAPDAWLAIVGLAPGERGANRTGRPFSGDAAGALLFATLARFGLVRPGADGWLPDGVWIGNAVRCLPPGNRPLPAEIHSCRPFLAAGLAALPSLAVVLALGEVAHRSVVKALGGKLPKHRFAHGAVHRLQRGPVLIDSYHCSRRNQNSGRLAPGMLDAVVEAAIALRHQSALA